MSAETPPGGLASAAPGPTDEQISRALDRLALARVRRRDVTDRLPVSHPREEAIERAHRALDEAEAALLTRSDDPEAQKTHALAEIAAIMALRRAGFRTWDDYLEVVAPQMRDPRLRQALHDTECEFAAAQAEWDQVKAGLLDPSDDGPVLDLRGEKPLVDGS